MRRRVSVCGRHRWTRARARVCVCGLGFSASGLHATTSCSARSQAGSGRCNYVLMRDRQTDRQRQRERERGGGSSVDRTRHNVAASSAAIASAFTSPADTHYAPAYTVGALSDATVRPSVCLSFRLSVPCSQLNNGEIQRIEAMMRCIHRPATPCTKDSSSLGACRRLEQDGPNTTQQGVSPCTTLQRGGCGSVTLP